MKSLGFGRARVDEIRKPPGFHDVLKSFEAQQRAESVVRNGVMQPLRIRKRDMLLVFGQRRLAAAIIADLPDVPCEWIECGDDELEEMRIDENLERQHLTQDEIDQLRSRKAELIADRILAEAEESESADEGPEFEPDPDVDSIPDPVDPPTKKKPGRKPSPARKARQEAAKNLGVSEATVARAQKKQKPPAPTPLGFKDLGLEIPDDVRKRLAGVRASFKEATANVKGLLSAFKSLGDDLPAVISDGFVAELEKVETALRDGRPVSVCLSCKLKDRIQQVCATCSGGGWINKGEVEFLKEQQPDLFDTDDPKIIVNGNIRRMAEL